MQRLVIDQPYEFVPPNRGRLWPWLLLKIIPELLRRRYGIVSVDCQHAEKVEASQAAGAGIVLAPNHCRDEDPFVLAMLARQTRQPFYAMASWHLFMQGKVQRFLLPRAGAFSVYREGVDRSAVNLAVEILEKAERPLVLFPEGFIARTNDHLNELMDGVSLIARTAAKRRAKIGKGVVIHPVALRYRFLGDIEKAADEVLGEIETRLSWQPMKDASLLDRIRKVGAALLTLKELEYLGQSGAGAIAPRIAALTDAILNPLEDQRAAGTHDGTINARVKRLRAALVPELLKSQSDPVRLKALWSELADVYLANELSHYPPDYVTSNPTPERILETIERLEEDLTDRIRCHGPLTATVTVGDAIEVLPGREGRGTVDPLLNQIGGALRAMLSASERHA